MLRVAVCLPLIDWGIIRYGYKRAKLRASQLEEKQNMKGGDSLRRNKSEKKRPSWRDDDVVWCVSFTVHLAQDFENCKLSQRSLYYSRCINSDLEDCNFRTAQILLTWKLFLE